MDSFVGTNALITGGASGIGLGLAKVLGRNGARVALASTNRAKIDGAVAELKRCGVEAIGIELDVADNGAGVPEAERKRIFERFYRVEQSRTPAGSGLGLSIVAAVAELHGAKIFATDNKPGLKIGLIFPAAA